MAKKKKGTRSPLDPVLFRPPFAYQGNKYQLMRYLLPMVPKHTRRFVDLFGGSGIVGATMLANHRCESVVYNDFDFNLALLLRYLHDVPPAEVASRQRLIVEQCFPVLGPEAKPAWRDLVARFNDFRLSFDVGALGAVPSVAPGDGFNELDILLFLARHAIYGDLHLSASGSISPVPALKKGEVQIKPPESLLPYCSAVYGAPIEYFSCDFRAAFFPDLPSVSSGMSSCFRDVVLSLGSGDFVYIDPPYLGTAAGYNSGYGFATEAFLLSFCSILRERGVRFLLSNNLDKNRSLFRQWIGMRGFNVFCSSVNYTTLKRIQGLPSSVSRGEVFVTDYPLPPSKHEFPPGLVRVKNIGALLDEEDAAFAEWKALEGITTGLDSLLL